MAEILNSDDFSMNHQTDKDFDQYVSALIVSKLNKDPHENLERKPKADKGV